MKGDKYVGSRPFCPCYKHHNRSAIYCLPVEDASNTSYTFDNPALRKRFMKRHCYPKSDATRCPFYPILISMHQGADDG